MNNQNLFYEEFEKRVEEVPDCPAIVSQDRFDRNLEITYRELKEKVEQRAKVLISEGVKPGDIIGVMTEDTIETVINVLGIIKTGSIYLPIDPGNSKSKIISKLEDVGASMLLTGTGEIQKFSSETFFTPRFIKVESQVTPPRPQITDLDSLPIPNRSLVNYEKYMQYIGQPLCKNYVTMQATRGCPYKCAYCHKIWPKTHVFRSAENLFKEVKLYYDIGVRRFAFVDDVFNLNIKNSSRFFQLIIKNGLNVQFFFPAGLRGDILTREYIDLMIEAGTVMIALALETASPRLQKLIGKNLNIEKLHKNIEYISKKYPQVILELFLMIGFPTETAEEALDTLRFLKSVKWIDFPYLFILKIFANTDMEKLAVENGISKEAIASSETLAYHELPGTLPFTKSLILQYQSDFLNEYFLSRERLLQVLPYQMKLLTEDELVQKYNSYLPTDIGCFTDLLEFVGITYEDLGGERCVDEEVMAVPNLNEKMKKCHGEKEYEKDALKILLLDLSQYFSSESDRFSEMIESPLGLMYLLTYLDQQFGSKIRGKIAKSRIDFDNYAELKRLIDEFEPGVIGIRTLTIYKDFFHKTTARIRQWGIAVPIICGGPYATSDYNLILQDGNVDLAVLGEGEVTFSQLIREIMENDGNLPGEEVLKEIPGLAFIPGSEIPREKSTLETGRFDEYIEHILKEIAGGNLLNLWEIDMLTENEKKQISEFYIEKGDDSYDF